MATTAARKSVKVNVIAQGRPRVDTDCAYIKRAGDSIVAIYIDMHSKRCDVDGCGGHLDNEPPQILIRETSESLHLDETQKDSETMIELPEFSGWEIWLAEIAKYTLKVCLIKRQPRTSDDAATPGLPLSERVSLSQAVYSTVFNSVESFEKQDIGSDLAYLLGAILLNTKCEWPLDRPLVKVLTSIFPKEHPVWLFINVTLA